MHKDAVTKMTYGPGMVHDLSSLNLDSIKVGSGDIVDAQGIQLEETTAYTHRTDHPLFSIPPTASYREQITEKENNTLFRFTIEGLGSHSSLALAITVAPHTTTTIIEQVSGAVLVVARIILTIGEGAQVTYVRHRSVPSPQHTAIYREAVVQKNASVHWYDVIRDEQECTYETTTRLVAEGASAKTYGVILGTKKHLLDTSHHTIHESPHTTSHTDIRIILDREARHLGRTKTTILAHASHSTANEEMHTLLLSEKTKSQTVPDLDIQENNVQCTHAVTTSRLSAEKLFYLSARGIDERQAKLLALEAHIAPSVQSTENGSEFITSFLAYE